MMQKKTPSILKKFLLFNLIIFSVLGLFTIFYLKAIQPNLVKTRTSSHLSIINNTADHIERLNIKFTEQGLKNFLLSTRFLFQSLDRVQFYNLSGDIIADTNILDLDQKVFSKSAEGVLSPVAAPKLLSFRSLKKLVSPLAIYLFNYLYEILRMVKYLGLSVRHLLHDRVHQLHPRMYIDEIDPNES